MACVASAGAAVTGFRDAALAAEAWALGLRADRRLFHQLRDAKIEFPCSDRGTAVVSLGATTVVAAVACEVVEPSGPGARHGFLEFFVRNAAPGVDALTGVADIGGTAAQAQALAITRLLDAVVKTARVLDTEGLCIVAGKAVWSIRVDVVVLNDAGNATDAAVWAALAALQHCRRPEVSVAGGGVVTVHDPVDRDPIPLNLHHVPLCFSAALLPRDVAAAARLTASAQQRADAADADFVLDPTPAEASAADGTLLVAMSAEGQLCDVRKVGGAGRVSLAMVQRLAAAARSLVPQLSNLFKEAMAADEDKRREAARAQFAWARKRVGVGKATQ